MKVVYDTRSGLGEAFARKLSDDCQSIEVPLSEPCILVTRNVGLGMIPKTTKAFLDQYAKYVQGVVVNGDKRYGAFYCGAASKIEKAYKLKILRKIEGAGNDEDVEAVRNLIQ